MRHYTFLAALAGALLAGNAQAQDIERIRPRELPQAEPQVVPLPLPAPAPTTAGERVILPALKGLVFVPSPDRVQAAGVSREGIDSSAVPLLNTDEFVALLAPFLGQPVTFDLLNEIARQVVLYFRSRDYPLVDVVLPEHNVSTGVVQFWVTEFRAGEIRAEGNRYFSSELLEGEIGVAPGERVGGSRLLDDIAWLNRNPFRQVDLVYERGQEPGHTDIVLRTRDRFPLRLYGGFENTGTPATGRSRWLTGFNWGNAFGLDHQLGYQFTGSSDVIDPLDPIAGRPDQPRYMAHAVSYTAPLPWRHLLNVYGAYSEAVPVLPSSLNQTGVSKQVGLRYTIPLPRTEAISHELRLGADFKRTNSNLEFGGQQVFQSDIDIFNAVGEYQITMGDALGATSLTGSVFASPGGVTDNNRTSVFQGAGGRAGAQADYVYARLAVERLTRLPESFSLLTRAQGQVSSAPLLASEQLTLGGYSTVRGFEENEIAGDRGAMLVNEIRAPGFSLVNLLGGPDVGDDLVFLTFLDLGVVGNRAAIAGQFREASLASTGIGFRYAINPYLTMRLDYGWSLDGLTTDALEGAHGHFGIILSY